MIQRSSALIGGIVGGAVLALAGLGFGSTLSSVVPDTSVVDGVAGWLTANLGSAVWLFLVVLGAYAAHLGRLRDLLRDEPARQEVLQLDQLTDVWIHLFIGIGVVWTAIGMRAALQAALGDPNAALTDSAGDVLQRLVDGGILLALSTTIFGGIGGYLMRVYKSVALGARLQSRYDKAARIDTESMNNSLRRIEHFLHRRAAQTEPGSE